jgi:2-oxoglutarate ferredoxin oxidoreductase subunit delta
MAKVYVIEESCKGTDDCGICLTVCPKGLFEPSGRMNQAGYIPPRVTDMAECTGCQSCMIYCPDMALVAEKDESEEAS